MDDPASSATGLSALKPPLAAAGGRRSLLALHLANLPALPFFMAACRKLTSLPERPHAASSGEGWFALLLPETATGAKNAGTA